MPPVPNQRTSTLAFTMRVCIPRHDPRLRGMSMKFQKSLLKKFFYFINERHAIYLRRAAGEPYPWTKDPILQKHRFCNVFRELDKVTVWIRKNWREPYADHKNLAFSMAVARQINLPATLKEFGFPKRWNPERLMHVLADRMERGKRAYTGAYMLTGTLGGPKPLQTAFKILDSLYRDPPKLVPGMSLEEAFNEYKGRPGFGPFMSYEVVTDLRYTRYLSNAPDIMTWANAGPGAKRGLLRLQGLQVRGPDAVYRMPNDEALEGMRELLKMVPDFVGDHVPLKDMDMRAIEHSTCEFDKMMRALNGEGVLERFRPQKDGSLM